MVAILIVSEAVNSPSWYAYLDSTLRPSSFRALHYTVYTPITCTYPRSTFFPPGVRLFWALVQSVPAKSIGFSFIVLVQLPVQYIGRHAYALQACPCMQMQYGTVYPAVPVEQAAAGCPSKPAARKLGAMNWIKHCILASRPTSRPASRVRNGGRSMGYGVSTGSARGRICMVVGTGVLRTESCISESATS